MDACLVGWCVSLLEFALEPPPVHAEAGGAHTEGGGGATADDTAAARGQIAARGLSQERRARLAAAAASFAVFVAGEAPAPHAGDARAAAWGLVARLEEARGEGSPVVEAGGCVEEATRECRRALVEQAGAAARHD